MIIDCHSHVGIDIKNYLKGDYPFCFDLNYFVQLLKLSNVDLAFSFPFPTNIYLENNIIYKDIAPYIYENNLLLKQVSMYGDNKIIPFLIIHPKIKVNEQIEFIKKNVNFIGGLKLHTTETQTNLEDLSKSKFMNFIIENKLPLIIHSGDGEYSNPETMLKTIEKFKDVNFLIAHLADFNKNFFDYIEEKGLKNIFIDICPFYGLFTRNKIYGKNKIIDFEKLSLEQAFLEIINKYNKYLVFGTDAPYTYELNEEYNYNINSSYKDNLLLLKIIEDKGVYDLITYKNALKFLGDKNLNKFKKKFTF